MSAFDDVYNENLRVLIEVISKWPDADEYVGKFRRIQSILMERLHQLYDVQENHFNTLNHDDLLRPNLMLKIKSPMNSDEKSIENVILVDFQYAYWL